MWHPVTGLTHTADKRSGNSMNVPPLQPARRWQFGIREIIKAGLLVFALMAAVTWLYSPGWSGSWHYDDSPSLSGLENVDGAISALAYAGDGVAGPLGRPIALLSFALQAEAWPEDTRGFLVVNTLIHAINGALVFILAFVLGRFLAPDSRNLPWFAFGVAAIWSLSPFLASASLMVVQRMTTLSATFVFAGLVTYLHGRWMMSKRPKLGLATALFGLAIGTLLAVFTKENGALLPLFALACEALVVRRARRGVPALPRLWLTMALVLPTCLVFGYLAYRGIAGIGYEHRSFGVLERLMTQARIIWDYALNLTIPRTSAVTPYTDSQQVSRGLLDPPTTLAAIFGLCAVVLAAAFARRRYPVFAFGVAWFLGGHALESSTIALEPYFGHRNYVPAFGLYFAVIYLLFFSEHTEKYRNLVVVGLIVYAMAFSTVLVSTASLWGQPALAAEMWYMRDESSVRAAQGLAKIYLEEGDPVAADHVIEDALEQNPGNQLLSVQALRFCHYGAEDYQARVARADRALGSPGQVNFASASQLYSLAQRVQRLDCEFLDSSVIERLLDTALQDPHRHRNAKTTHQIHYVGAELASQQSDFSLMRNHFRKALRAWPDPQTVVLIAYSMVLENDIGGARNYLRTKLEEAPHDPIQRTLWEREIREYLESLEG